jgi:cytoskeletal protein RodZ
MKLVSLSRRLPAAVAVLLLSVGTALAAAPLSHPSHPTSRPDSAETQEPTDSPETETPEPTDSPETESPETESPNTTSPGTNTTADAGTGVSTSNLDRIVGLLLTNGGITTTSAELKLLADQVGVGGAVRVLEFAKDSGKTTAEIVAMFKAGEGWGKIRKDLTLTGSSGIGRIMGGHGKGHTKHH